MTNCASHPDRPAKTAPLLWLGAAGSFALYVAATAAVLLSSSAFMDLMDGFIICRNDCTDYDNLSHYLLQNWEFHQVTADAHSSVLYRGFVLYIAILKGLFGQSWSWAFLFLNLAMTVGLFAWLACQAGRAVDPVCFFAVAMALVAFNLRMLMYYKFLLNDYFFAAVAAFILFLLAAGVGRSDRGCLVAGILLAIPATFIRPTGVFLLAIAGACLLASMIGRARRASVLLGVLAGLCAGGVGVIAVASVWAGQRPDAVGSLSTGLSSLLGILLELNYFGQDGRVDDGQLEASIVNFPYKLSMAHEGHVVDVLAAISMRFVKIFELFLPDYSGTHNMYRLAYYGFLYGAGLVFMVRAVAVWRAEPERLIVVFMTAAYLILVCGVVHVEQRYLLILDFLLIACAAMILAEAAEAMARRWKRRGKGGVEPSASAAKTGFGTG